MGVYHSVEPCAWLNEFIVLSCLYNLAIIHNLPTFENRLLVGIRHVKLELSQS